ncbi:hypothetical protein CHS0354_024785 [Potamilus streckersoni]|uniref:SH2 domain-containing protein n=1 Tax=Potamilus streckersoni TaxID=2493646 RepID=A0AAE0W2Y3_9BIVA|nr:hypothetical protein CHS0354_024785 [Potamilus streckersoni]
MAYAQQRQRHQPTFHELIEQQLAEQKAKFEEYQQEAQRVLQERLTEIATPTPFSEKALQRMEIRRQNSTDELQEKQDKEFVVGKNKVWAKQVAEKVHHRTPLVEPSSMGASQGSSSNRPLSANFNSNRSPYDPSSKRNSTPPHSSPVKHFGALLDTPSKRNSSPQLSAMQNFSVMTIRESLDSDTNNSHRYKGSPVTALKDAIDRSYTNGGFESMDSGFCFKKEEVEFASSINTNSSNPESPRSSKIQNRPLPALPTDTKCYPNSRVSPQLKPWNSFDDDSIPRHTKSPPYYARQRNSQESPKRRPQRPQSEIFLDSKTSLSTYGFQDPGMYTYGSKQTLPNNQTTESSAFVPEAKKSPNANQRNDNTQNVKNGLSPPSVMLRYQNDSPFSEQKVSSYATPDEGNQSKQSGLETLMGLDRSHIEDQTLRLSSWYQAGIPRDVALEILQQEEIGSFIVRDSTTHPGCYALSVRVPKFENPTGISHYLVLKTQRGVKLKGLDKEWPNLLALVTHHTVMPEMLPCTLRLPRNSNNPSFKDSDKDDKDEDPDYQRLADFSTMMAALKK